MISEPIEALQRLINATHTASVGNGNWDKRDEWISEICKTLNLDRNGFDQALEDDTNIVKDKLIEIYFLLFDALGALEINPFRDYKQTNDEE